MVRMSGTVRSPSNCCSTRWIGNARFVSTRTVVLSAPVVAQHLDSVELWIPNTQIGVRDVRPPAANLNGLAAFCEYLNSAATPRGEVEVRGIPPRGSWSWCVRRPPQFDVWRDMPGMQAGVPPQNDRFKNLSRILVVAGIAEIVGSGRIRIRRQELYRWSREGTSSGNERFREWGRNGRRRPGLRSWNARRIILIFVFAILFAYLISPVVKFLQCHSSVFQEFKRAPPCHGLRSYVTSLGGLPAIRRGELLTAD